MPVKWTPEVDQMLLLKILETHELKVDAKKISAAWPTDRGEAPTARAITERLVKIRQNAKASGAGHFGISSAQSKSATSTPSKPRKPKPGNGDNDSGTGPSTPAVSPSKRKHENAAVKQEPIDLDGTDEYGQNGGYVQSAPRSSFVSRTSTGHDLAELVGNPDSLKTPTKPMQGLSMRARHEGGEDDAQSPTKRPRQLADHQPNYESEWAGEVDFGSDDEGEDELEVLA